MTLTRHAPLLALILAVSAALAVVAASPAALAEGADELDIALYLGDAGRLSNDDLAGAHGALLRGGVPASFGVDVSRRYPARLPVLPAAPSVSGLSLVEDAAVKSIMNEIVPQVLTAIVGSEIPAPGGATTEAAPLFAGFSFLPIPGRP